MYIYVGLMYFMFICGREEKRSKVDVYWFMVASRIDVKHSMVSVELCRHDVVDC